MRLLKLSGEDALQVAVADYLRIKGFLFHHSPNEGKRTFTQQWRIKAMGVNSGFPDFVIYPQSNLGGNNPEIYIELKYGNNKPSDNQLIWADKLHNIGRFYIVCWSFDGAVDVINHYKKEGQLPLKMVIDRTYPYWVSLADTALPKWVKKQL